MSGLMETTPGIPIEWLSAQRGRAVRRHEEELAGRFGGSQHVLGTEYLEQPQDLDELAFAALAHAGLDQAPQGGEFLGQVPAGQRRRLVESADLLFEQRQVMQRVEDKILALVGARMTRDHLGPAADHHLVDVAADQNLAVTIGGRHRIVGAPIAYQRQ